MIIILISPLVVYKKIGETSFFFCFLVLFCFFFKSVMQILRCDITSDLYTVNHKWCSCVKSYWYIRHARWSFLLNIIFSFILKLLIYGIILSSGKYRIYDETCSFSDIFYLLTRYFRYVKNCFQCDAVDAERTYFLPIKSHYLLQISETLGLENYWQLV
jgi:hypothetical protein